MAHLLVHPQRRSSFRSIVHVPRVVSTPSPIEGGWNGRSSCKGGDGPYPVVVEKLFSSYVMDPVLHPSTPGVAKCIPPHR